MIHGFLLAEGAKDLGPFEDFKHLIKRGGRDNESWNVCVRRPAHEIPASENMRAFERWGPSSQIAELEEARQGSRQRGPSRSRLGRVPTRYRRRSNAVPRHHGDRGQYIPLLLQVRPSSSKSRTSTSTSPVSTGTCLTPTGTKASAADWRERWCGQSTPLHRRQRSPPSRGTSSRLAWAPRLSPTMISNSSPLLPDARLPVTSYNSILSFIHCQYFAVVTDTSSTVTAWSFDRQADVALQPMLACFVEK